MRIAVAQAPGARLDQWGKTLELVDDLLSRAARLRADVVALPECVWPAYCLGSREAYFAARAAGMPGPDEFLRRVGQQARSGRFAACVSFVEEEGERLFNAACWIAADGVPRGRYRKCFLWDFDHSYFEPGERIEPVDTALGRVGLMICADARLPEIPATLAARGASLILQPTAWVNGGEPERLWNPQPDFLIAARAREFGLPIASASKWGIEGETTFVGSSLICDADGRVLAQCGQRETAVAVADVEPGRPQRLEMTAQQRAALLAADAWVRPADVVPLLNVSLLPASVDRERAGDYLRRIPPQTGLPALWLRPSNGSHGPRDPLRTDQVLCLDGLAAEPFALGAIGIAATSAAQSRCFAPIRCHTLRGIHLAVVFGDETAEGLVRARACENRIFIIWAHSDAAVTIDPRGVIVAEQRWPDDLTDLPRARLDLRAAADKEAARNTHMIAGRRPGQYAF